MFHNYESKEDICKVWEMRVGPFLNDMNEWGKKGSNTACAIP